MHSCPIVTGFDGFVDEIITLVGERRTLDNFTSVPDIATFGTLISAAAGHNSLRDIVVNDVHPDGCAVNHFEPAGPVTLKLNGNEANILCRLHDMPYSESDTSAEVVLQQAFTLREQLGVAENFSVEESLSLACAVSGFFVRNPRSANHQELSEFLGQRADRFFDATD